MAVLALCVREVLIGSAEMPTTSAISDPRIRNPSKSIARLWEEGNTEMEKTSESINETRFSPFLSKLSSTPFLITLVCSVLASLFLNVMGFFSRKNKFEVDGKVGPRTLQFILSILTYQFKRLPLSLVALKASVSPSRNSSPPKAPTS